MEIIGFVAVGLLAIAGANAIAPRIGVAAPLLLVVLGIAASFLPALTGFELDPEWILALLLPPLLYAAAANMPTTDFRREFSTISALSVVLVVISAIVLGLFFSWIIPDLNLWWGIALGAVISPTDAAATAIAKKSKLSGRLISILEGESLFNDATALVLLRTAVAAAAVSFSFWHTLGTFVYSVVVASAIGIAAGAVILWSRSKVLDAPVGTMLSFAAPFVASVPAEHLGASGLVAAVAAGLVSGHGSIKHLNSQQRMSDKHTWKPVELVLEGTIFLMMGLQVTSLIEDVNHNHEGFTLAIGGALGALALVVFIRAAFIVPVLWQLRRVFARSSRVKERLDDFRTAFAEADSDGSILSALPTGKRRERFARRTKRFYADYNYYNAQPLGKGAGVVLLWSGMRGAITLAAAQTLPVDTPHRSLLVLIAFIAATVSLLVQGLSLPAVISRFAPKRNVNALAAQEGRLVARLREVADAAVTDTPAPKRAQKRAQAQYAELLKARSEGFYDSEVLQRVLMRIDAEQLYRSLRREE